MDVCRQSVVFDTLEDLAAALDAIAADPAVRVVRVKNRMHAGYNAALSAGSESRPRPLPCPIPLLQPCGPTFGGKC